MKKTVDTDNEVVLFGAHRYAPLNALLTAFKWARHCFMVYLLCLRRALPCSLKKQWGTYVSAALSLIAGKVRPVIKPFTIAYYDGAVVLGESWPSFFRNRQVT